LLNRTFLSRPDHKKAIGKKIADGISPRKGRSAGLFGGDKLLGALGDVVEMPDDVLSAASTST
jgi:hypothetical protein